MAGHRQGTEVVGNLQGSALNFSSCLGCSCRAALAMVGRSAPGRPGAEAEDVTPSGLHLSQCRSAGRWPPVTLRRLIPRLGK